MGTRFDITYLCKLSHSCFVCHWTFVWKFAMFKANGWNYTLGKIVLCAYLPVQTELLVLWVHLMPIRIIMHFFKTKL